MSQHDSPCISYNSQRHYKIRAGAEKDQTVVSPIFCACRCGVVAGNCQHRTFSWTQERIPLAAGDPVSEKFRRQRSRKQLAVWTNIKRHPMSQRSMANKNNVERKDLHFFRDKILGTVVHVDLYYMYHRCIPERICIHCNLLRACSLQYRVHAWQQYYR